MFSLSELASLSERQGSSKLLKPWWEVFMEYLVVLMLMVSVLSGTLLLSRDRVVCLPLDLTTTPTNQNTSFSSGAVPQPHPPNRPPTKASPLPANPWTPARGRRTHLDYQQYVYISHVCYHKALPWYSRFFPYVALLQSLVLLASSCFWFHFPLTSARIEHFLTILAKCCESPWTSRVLSHAAREEEGGEETGPQDLQMPPPTHRSSLSVSRNRQISLDSGTDSPLLVRSDSVSTAAPPSPCPSTLSRTSSLSSMSLSRAHVPTSKSPVVLDGSRQVASLDRRDGEQARALFERVRRFRSHCENSEVIYKVRGHLLNVSEQFFDVSVYHTTPSHSLSLFSALSCCRCTWPKRCSSCCWWC